MGQIQIKRHRDFAIIGILFVGLLVRIWGVGFGLPYDMTRPDEAYVVFIALSFGVGSLDPNSFIYPSFYLYLLFLLFAAYFLLGLFLGKYDSAQDLGFEYLIDPTNFFLIDRMLSAFFGVLSVFVVFKIAQRLFDRRTGIIASLFLALAYLHVRESHFGTVDIAVTFFLLISMLFIVKSLTKETEKNTSLGGIFAGLAASTKYYGVFMIIPMLVVRATHSFRKSKGLLRVIWDRRMGLFISLLFLTFIIGTPYAILNYKKFISDLLTNVENLNFVWAGVFLGRGWWYHFRVSLFYGLGWSLLISSLSGLVILFLKAPRKALLLSAFPVVYYLSIGRGYAVFVRYMAPVVPFLVISAAFFTVTVGSYLQKLLRWRKRWLIEFLIALFILLPSLWNIILFDFLLTKKDSRLLAREWVYVNIEPGSSVYQTAADSFKLRSTRRTIEKQYQDKLTLGGGRNSVLAQILLRELEFMERENISGYNSWTWDKASSNFLFNGEVREGLPDYIIKETSGLLGYSRIPDGISGLLDSSYVLIQAFEVVDIHNPNNVYDQQDRFYLPLAGFKGVERPGPNILIYQRQERHGQ